MIAEDVPWEAQTFRKQVGSFKQLLQSIRANKNMNSQEWGVQQGYLCSAIRKVIERAIEEVLTAGIVERYRRAIRTSNVKQLAKIHVGYTDLLDGLMTKYSSFEHAQVAESRVALPDLDQLESDLLGLEGWADEFRGAVKPLDSRAGW